MKTVVIAAILTLSFTLAAQETRREVVRTDSVPASGAKPGDPAPDSYLVNAHVQRVVVLRCKYNTDLLGELRRVVEREKIKNAIILSAFGSVRSYHLHQVANGEFPAKEIYEKNPNAPADIIGMSGAVVNGRTHAHITLSTADKAFGGHLEPDTKVFTFAIVTLGIVDDSVDLSRIDDANYR